MGVGVGVVAQHTAVVAMAPIEVRRSAFGRLADYGGVGNTAVPNLVYRFTEIIKVVHCYAPYAKPDIHFFYSRCIPWVQLRRRRNRAFFSWPGPGRG